MKRAKSNLLYRLMKSLNHEIKQQKLAHSIDERSASRRKFLATTAKGAIGAGLSFTLPAIVSSCGAGQNDEGEVLDVAILGGGISGMNCANHLLSTNLSFKVFEGSKRLGGRILTHYNDSLGLGIFPEFGGDFIDSNHEEMLSLAKEFNIEIIDLEKEQQDRNLVKDLYYFDNRLISEKEIIAEFKKVASVISSDADSLGENYDTPEAVKLDNTPLNEYIDALNCKPWLKEILSAALVAEFGLDCAEQSAINLLDLVDTDTSEGFKVFGESDERYRLKGGNSKIIEGLAKKIGDDRILKNYKVTEISENEKGLYEIVFSNARKVIAKQVVCTIPFTILRAIKLNLKNISADKRKCIDELGYGMNTKLALGYKGTPWSEKPNSAMGYIFHKTISNGWDSSYNKTENNENGCYICYFGGSVSMGLNDKSFKNKFAPPTHVWRTELPQEEVDSMVGQLDDIFKNSKANFLGKHVFVNWIDYPYSKGSYSCYKKGQWTTLSGKEIEPIGNFYFAGEHCSEKFQGFMNGGAETGRHVAEIIKGLAKA